MSIGPATTLSPVGITKAERERSAPYDEATAAHARAALKAFKEAHPPQENAARLLGISQGELSKLIRGPRQPQLKTLLILARRTGRSLDEILGLRPPTVEADSRANAVELSKQYIVETVRTEFEPLLSLSARMRENLFTALEFAVLFDSGTKGRSRYSTALAAAVNRDHADARKLPEEWDTIFEAKRKELEPIEVARVVLRHVKRKPAHKKKAAH
jgi:transcriptional regulator with XRE-family HTH domain